LEASAKVPFILQYPGKVKPKTIVQESLGCVDFLPTILNLMGVATAGKEEGRDASGLFTGNRPADWQDITFIRGHGTNIRDPQYQWVAAVTKRYKLVLSLMDAPWLIDMDKDPDELKNFCTNPEYRSVVRNLAVQLAAYHDKFKDPSLSTPKFQYDLKWAVSDSPDYDAAAAPEAPVGKGKEGRP